MDLSLLEGSSKRLQLPAKNASWEGGQLHLAQEVLLLRARCSWLEGLGSCSGSIQGKPVVEILQRHRTDTLQKTVISPSAPAVILWGKFKAAFGEGLFKTCSTTAPALCSCVHQMGGRVKTAETSQEEANHAPGLVLHFLRVRAWKYSLGVMATWSLNGGRTSSPPRLPTSTVCHRSAYRGSSGLNRQRQPSVRHRTDLAFPSLILLLVQRARIGSQKVPLLNTALSAYKGP